MKKTPQFRRLLSSPDLEFLLEAYNGLSARIGVEAGFRGLWASGLYLDSCRKFYRGCFGPWLLAVHGCAVFLSQAIHQRLH